MSKILMPSDLPSVLQTIEDRLKALETTPNVSLKFLTSVSPISGGTATVTGAGAAAAWVDMTNTIPSTPLVSPIVLDRPSRILAFMSTTMSVTGTAGTYGQVRGLIRNLGSGAAGQPIFTGLFAFSGTVRIAQFIFYMARNSLQFTPQIGYFATGIIPAGNYEAAIQATIDNALESVSTGVQFDVFAVS